MSKTSETGHAKNVANFEEMINLVLSYKEAYNPSRDAIKVEALQTLLSNAKNCMTDINNAISPYKMAAAERETTFKPLNPLVTRLINSLKATETTSKMDETAQSLARKIKGQRATAIKETAPAVAGASTEADTKHISSAQTSYDNQLDNFDKLIIHLQNIPQFAPNEPELQPQALKAYQAELVAKNNQAKLTDIALSNARIARNKVLYAPLTGLVDIASDVKTYVKSVFGATGPEFKQVSKIEFKTNK